LKFNKKVSAQITLGAEAQIIAFMLTMLSGSANYQIERIIRTVCGYFGFAVERR